MSNIPERDVSATGGNPSSEDEVPTSVSRWAKQTNENLPCEGERTPVRYIVNERSMSIAISMIISVFNALHPFALLSVCATD